MEFLGRVDQQVKLRGYRIELGEVEYVLSNFPGVYQAAVLLRQDKPEQQRLVGYVTGQPVLKAMLDHVRSELNTRLPHYMVPSIILWVEAMPLSATGKINRSALPVPEETAGQAAARVAPRNQVEESLTELWKAVLAVPDAGIHDNFFERGGHSLLATQLVSRMREVFEVDVSLRAVFDRPTIAALAEEVMRVGARSRRLQRLHRSSGYLEINLCPFPILSNACGSCIDWLLKVRRITCRLPRDRWVPSIKRHSGVRSMPFVSVMRRSGQPLP